LPEDRVAAEEHRGEPDHADAREGLEGPEPDGQRREADEDDPREVGPLERVLVPGFVVVSVLVVVLAVAQSP
jgi:hypothetical protein